MSKAGAIAATLVGAATITTGGYYLVKGRGISALADAETFKEDLLKNQECIKDLFGGDKVELDDSVANPDSTPIDFFGNAADTSKGCLIFAQSRKPVENGKWSHVTNWTWVFVNGDRGFVNFNSALAVDDKEVSGQQNQQMTFNGKFYLLEKSTEGSQNIWKVKWRDEMKNNSKSLSQDQFPNWIPSLSPKLKPKEAGATGDGQPQVSLDAGVNQQEQKEIQREQVWKYKSGTGDNLVGIGEWSSNLEWWNSMYSGTKSKGFDLANKLSSFKGTWEEVNLKR